MISWLPALSFCANYATVLGLGSVPAASERVESEKWKKEEVWNKMIKSRHNIDTLKKPQMY